MNGYIAFLHGKRIEIEAETLYAASVKAREVLKPTKRNIQLVSVTLAECPLGNPINHVITN